MPAGSRDAKGGGRKGSGPSTSPLNSLQPSPTPSSARVKLSIRPGAAGASAYGNSAVASSSRSGSTGTGNRVGRPRKLASAQRGADPIASSSKASSSKSKSRSRFSFISSDSDSDSSELTPDEGDDMPSGMLDVFDDDTHPTGIYDDDDDDDAFVHDEDGHDLDDDDDMLAPQAGSSKKGRKGASTPRKGKADIAASGTPSRKALEKGKGKAAEGKSPAAPAASASKKKVARTGKEPVPGKVTITGPAGRERKRTVRLGEQERRRARDEKFGVGGNMTPNVTSPTPRSYADDDGASSYGDDESGPDQDPTDIFGQFGDDLPPSFGLGNFGFENTLDSMFMLPDAFAGQEVEDLAYGAGSQGEEEDNDPMAAFWQPEEDEDEEMLITQLSGSEADRQSQSTLHSDTDELMSDSDASDSTEDGVDEFGLPIVRTADGGSDSADPPLVLMENWDGQFILVEPRKEKSRKRRSSRTTGGTGSVSGSTVLSTHDQQGLLIDPDADHYQDGAIASDESSEWSGVSDEESGDTTDSMAEEDMPMLDSPALACFIEQQVGAAAAANGAISPMPLPSPEPVYQQAPMGATVPAAPAIVVTDTSLPESPPLSILSSGGTPGITAPMILPTQFDFAANPAVAQFTPTPPPQPKLPFMGTFMPTTDHPSQHAVIDGTKTVTTSPFTHRRRVKKGRAGSMSSMGTAAGTPGAGANGVYDVSSVGGASAAAAAAKAKRRSRSTTGGFDPFASPRSGAVAATLAQRKSALYSSIPGHPRYKAAQRRQRRETEGSETTPSEGEVDEVMQLRTEAENTMQFQLDVDEWLDAGVMVQHQHQPHPQNQHYRGQGESGDDSAGQLRHLSRFDRGHVVTNYLRHHMNSGGGGRGRGSAHANGRIVHAHPHIIPASRAGAGPGVGDVAGDRSLTYDLSNMSWTSPVRKTHTGIDETLAGPMGRMLVSPVLVPSMAEGRKSRRHMDRLEI